MRILLVEPYLGGSHRAWVEGYAAHSAHEIIVVSHEARFWKWRMHGAHLTLAAAASEEIAANGRPDVVLASSMLNLAGFLGATRGFLGDRPAALYFHESQFTYPLSPLDRRDLSYPMVNWQSAVVADRVFFNSDYHRDVFLRAVPAFLRSFPDHRHTDLVSAVASRAEVLPVGVDLRRLQRRSGAPSDRVPLLLWNQRWEHDKGPDEFIVLLEDLVAAGVDVRVALAGEQFVSAPAGFDRLPDLLGDRLVWLGFAGEEDYVRLLAEADVVVSTAHQEFFGIAVVEAIFAGAFPVLPNRLVYPERIPRRFHPLCLYESREDLAAKVQWACGEGRDRAAEVADELLRTVSGFDWTLMAPRYDEHLERLAR